MVGLIALTRLGALTGIVITGALFHPASAAELAEPPVLSSANHVLDLLMVAKPEPVKLDPFRPTGWVYDICPRPHGANTCPASKANRYGGTRLQLEKGDTLKIRLINKLPLALDSKHQLDPGGQYLWLNPTNLHTHGLLVSPRFPTVANPTYGDNVFVLTLNPANGGPPAGSHLHGDVRYGFTDYEIKIPLTHPSGLYWFHPHAHGLSLNQISAGMAGIITIGNPSDYICTVRCGLPGGGIPLRHMILKDTQVLPPNALLDQENPAFCDAEPDPADPPRKGSCLYPLGSGTGTDRGRWFFTINGQQYPNVTVGAPAGQIWRITNASASVAYNLQLTDAATQRNMLMQVVSIDGVSVQPNTGESSGALTQLGGAKFTAVTCPTVGDRSPPNAQPLCVRRLLMYPSSRVEVWVTYRDANDRPALPPAGAKAVLRDIGVQTGPDGDAWPSVDLASVVFKSGGASGAMPSTLEVNGEAGALMQPAGLAAELAADNKAFVAEADCKPLAKGHSRRIFFNSIQPTGAVIPAEEGPEPGFGLGYEELDEHGKPVPGTFVDVTAFNPDKPTICLTLGPHNAPATERWQLINLAGEDHNFHMHQTKFRLVSQDEVEGTPTPMGSGILHDNVPVAHADGTCVSVSDWRHGVCKAHPVTVEIPFSVAGDYVYHCHILEHEDGGMMARIRVRASR